MTLAQRQRIAQIQAKNTFQPDPTTTFLLDVIRQMQNHRLGITGLSDTPTPDAAAAGETAGRS